MKRRGFISGLLALAVLPALPEFSDGTRIFAGQVLTRARVHPAQRFEFKPLSQQEKDYYNYHPPTEEMPLRVEMSTDRQIVDAIVRDYTVQRLNIHFVSFWW